MAALPLITTAVAETSPSVEPATTDRPNIVLIYGDDLGAGLLGAYGQKIIKTPNIDRLAAEGMIFNNAHGCVYCAPARASMITGLHDSHRNAWSIVKGGLLVEKDMGKMSEQEMQRQLARAIPAKPNEVFLAQVAKNAGYTTAQFGKLDWGFTTTHDRLVRHGWDYYFGYYDHVRAHGFYPTYLWKNGEKVMLPGNTHHNAGKTYEGGYDKKEATEVRRDKTGKVHYSQNVLIKDLLQYLDDHKDQRFFLYHPTQIPHGPVDVPGVHPDFVNDNRLTDVQKEYASMVKLLDDHVGLIMARLKKLGLDDKTMIAFTSDNGHALYYIHNKLRSQQRSYHGELDVFKGSLDLAGMKWTNWQGGIRVPLIVRWPGKVKAGSQTDRLTAAYDYMPTFADVMGTEAPKGKDGSSFYPTLLGKEQPKRGPIIVHQAVVADGWKLVRDEEQKDKEVYLLFNLKDDPGERHDLAAKHPEKFQQLMTIFQREVGSPRKDL
ncbi:MAG: arylsulfatase [Akkermansiaceae bacterium]|nr:arylsulfatase [Akkermansiaceae bacterium]